MEAFHEVAGIELVPSDWLKGSGQVAVTQQITQDEPLKMVMKCHECKLEWDFRLEQKSVTFAEILCKPPTATRWVR